MLIVFLSSTATFVNFLDVDIRLVLGTCALSPSRIGPNLKGEYRAHT